MKASDILHSTAFRLSFVYMLLFAGSVLLLLGLIYWLTVGYMSDQTDATIETEIIGLAEQYREGGLAKLIETMTDRIERDPDSSSIYLIASPGYAPLAGNLNAWPTGEQLSDGWLNFEITEGHSDGLSLHARAREFVLHGGLRLLVGRDTRELRATQKLIIRALVWGLLLTLLLAMAGGVIMSRSMLKRIDRINQTSREIMAGELQRRVATTGSNDEFDQLAVNLNAMLDEIDRLMSGVRHVTDNVAHDLRTPLTRLRTRLEQLRSRLGDANPNVAHVEQSISDADQLLATFGALLRIARIEAGGFRENFEPLDLATIVQDAVELYDAVAETKQVVINAQIEKVPQVTGDRDLLFQVVINLLDNALKYSTEKSQISISLLGTRDDILLIIADNGPGIPVHERDKVLQRFYRMDRSRSMPGSGLGLSLVSAVAEIHKVELLLEDNRPGLKVTLRFHT